MSITVREITDREQWNGFLTSQPHGHLLQSYEWGELSQYLGGRIYRLGALENGRLAGAMMLIVSPVPIPVPVPGLHFIHSKDYHKEILRQYASKGDAVLYLASMKEKPSPPRC